MYVYIYFIKEKNMKKYKVLTMALVLLFAASLLFAVGGRQQQDTTTPQSQLGMVVGSGSTRLIMYVNGPPTEDWLGYVWAQLYARRNPNVSFEFRGSADNNTHVTSIRLMANTNSLPDIYVNGMSNAHEYASMGVISDLTRAVEGDREWLNSFNPGVVDKWRINGRIYGIPFATDVQGWFFNKALFDRYNLPIPVTNDDFKRAITVFRQNGILPIAHGGRDNWARWGYDPWFSRHGLSDVVRELDAGTLKFSDPRANITPVFERIKEWADLGAYPPNATTMGYTEAIELFRAGNAAMITTGQWELGGFTNPELTRISNDIVFGWGPEFSGLRWDQKVGTKTQSWAFWVGKSLESRPDAYRAALDFLKFVCSPEVARISVEQYSHFPTVKVDLQGLRLQPLYASMLEKSGDNYTAVPEFLDTQNFSDSSALIEPYWNSVTGVITGTITPSEAVRLLDDWQALR